MSNKHLFSRSLAAAPGRLHMAAHSHHLWPDASLDGQVECWEDAARLADRKWGRVMGELWPAAQAEVAGELGSGRPDAILFAANTHDFLIRLWAAAPRRAGGPLRILTTDGEFHSARRQFARWEESGDILLSILSADPVDTLAQRLVAQADGADLIMVSQLMFGSGRMVSDLERLAALSSPAGPWLVVDGYHSFMALDRPFQPALAATAFYLAGGYKYAMAGEGLGIMHCPLGFGPRPPITGWYAEFDDLTLPPGHVGYAPDAMRFMGATFDPSAIYRFLHIRRALADAGLSTAGISAQVAAWQSHLLEAIADTRLGQAELLNPPAATGARARFLALRHPHAAHWQQALMAQDCITDVRGDVLRIGLGLYHDAEDVDRFAALAGQLS